MAWRRSKDELIAGAVGGVTVAVGLARAGDHPFWFDEAFTAGAAQQSLGDLGHFLWREAGMAPYYVVLWVWAHFGGSEWWLRSLSVLGGAAAVAVTYLFAARFVNRTVAALTVVGLWCNSFFLYNLTELRAYSWVMFSAVVTSWAFLRLRAVPTTSRAVAYGIAAGLSLGTLVFSAGLLVAHLVFARPLWRTSSGRRALVVSATVAAALLAPFAHALLTSDQIGWIPRTTVAWADLQTGGAFGGTKWRLFYAIGGALLVVSLIRRRRRATPHVPLEVFATGVVSTITTLLLLSLVEPVFIARYLAGALPLSITAGMAGYVFAAQAAIARVPRLAIAKPVVPVLLTAACVVGFRGTPFTDLPKSEDISTPGAALTAAVTADDAVVFGSEREQLAIGYYFEVPRGAHVIGWGDVASSDACTLWFVDRGAVADLEQQVRQLLPDATLVVAQYSGDAVIQAQRCS